jgi:hypothetical protein
MDSVLRQDAHAKTLWQAVRMRWLFLILLPLFACTSEPDNEWDRFLLEFDEKVAILFGHLDHPTDIEKGKFTALSSSGQFTQETRYLRYEKIGSAARDVMDHFMKPSVAFYLTITSAPEIDPAWKTRLQRQYAAAKAGFSERLDRFRRTMPRTAPEAQEISEIGRALDKTCAPGGMYSHSPRCGDKYGYTEDDELYFRVDGQEILIGHLFDFTIDDWLSSIAAAGKR